MASKTGTYAAALVGAVAVTLTVGAAGSAAAAWAGWSRAASLPSNADVTSLTQRLLPGAGPPAFARSDVRFDYARRATPFAPDWQAVLGADDYQPGYVRVTTPLATDRSAAIAKAAGVLAAEGWSVHRAVGDVVNADLGPDAVQLYPSDAAGAAVPAASATAVTLLDRRALPAEVTYLSLGGWAVGALLALVLFARGFRRRGRAVSQYAVGLGVLLLLPGTVVSSAYVLLGLTSRAAEFPYPQWLGYMFRVIKPAAIGGGALLLVAALIALFAPRRPAAPDPGTGPGTGAGGDEADEAATDSQTDTSVGPAAAASAVSAEEEAEQTAVLTGVVHAGPDLVNDGQAFSRHDSPAWRDRANFVINAKLPEAGRFEQLWSRQLGENEFEICCIPFFLTDVALGDVVRTAPADGRKYVLDSVLRRSGRAVFRAHFADPMQPGGVVAQRLTDSGALVEWSSSALLSIDAEDEEHAEQILGFLRENQGLGNLTYDVGMTAGKVG